MKNIVTMKHPSSLDKDILVPRLNGLLRTAREAPFYRNLYADCPGTVDSLEAFARFPVLEKQHLREKSVHRSMDMLTDPRGAGHYVFSAGGTTGAPAYVCYTPEELARGVAAQKRCFDALNLGPDDVVANCFRAGAFWTGYLVLNRSLEYYGCRILPMTSNQSVGETLDYLRLFRPNVVISVPPVIAALAEESERQGADLEVKKVLYAGNHMTLPQQEEVRRLWKTRYIGSAGYAAVETGPIGWQCAHCRGTEHHVLDDWCYLEREEDGNALVTVLERTYHPILRARIGDYIEWVEEPCPCGSSAPKFRLLSRSDDLIRLNFDEFKVSQVEPLFAAFPGFSGLFQLVLEPRGKKLHFLFRLETRAAFSVSPEERSALEASLRRRVMEEVPIFSQGWEANGVEDVVVRLEKPGALPRAPRTGKVRRVVDRRGENPEEKT